MGFPEAIKAMIPPEFIDGNNVDEVAEKCVDLDIEFTPVLADRFHDDPASNHFDIPRPVSVTKGDDGRYCIIDSGNFQYVEESSLKVMRARYLLFRGYLYTNFHCLLNYPEKMKAAGWYSLGLIPESGSPLAKLMGMNGAYPRTRRSANPQSK